MPRPMISARRAALVAIATGALLFFTASANTRSAYAQTPAARTPAVFVLVPYEEPGTKDPHALGVTQALTASLGEANITAKPVASMDHLDAVAHAGQLCAQNAATALLIPEGRYEQSEKTTPLPFGFRVKSYPTHVEVRLDAIDCRGTVAWSTRGVGDQSSSGVGFSYVPGTAGAQNLGAAVDECFRNAVKSAVADLAQAPAMPAIDASTVAPPPAAAPAALPASAVYLLLPFAQPGIADPRSDDMTGSLTKALAGRNLAVKAGPSIDRLTTLAQAGALCSQAGANAIVVPSIRLEQTTKTYGELRLDLVSCDGRLLARGTGTGGAGSGWMNLGAKMVEASEKATPGALDELFPATKVAEKGK